MPQWLARSLARSHAPETPGGRSLARYVARCLCQAVARPLARRRSALPRGGAEQTCGGCRHPVWGVIHEVHPTCGGTSLEGTNAPEKGNDRSLACPLARSPLPPLLG